MYVDFDPKLRGLLTNTSRVGEQGREVPIRRFSTESYVADISDGCSYNTQWRWYWTDDRNQWCPFKPVWSNFNTFALQK